MKAMENWKVKLAAGGQTRAEVKIQRCIFQGDSLLPFKFGNDATKLYSKEMFRGGATNLRNHKRK